MLNTLVLVGCQPADAVNEIKNSNKSERVDINERFNAPAQQEGKSVAYHTVEDITGYKVAIPVNPKRVVALSEFDLDTLITLGIKPLGSTAGRGQATTPGYLTKHTTGLEVVGQLGQPSLDKLIELNPDLILAGGFVDPIVLKQIKKIAPTVVTHKIGERWKKAFQRSANLLSRQQAAEEFLIAYTQRVNQLKLSLDDKAGIEISVVRWNPKGPAYMLSDSFVSLVLQDIQLKRPSIQNQPGAGHSPPLSLEALEKIDGDWLFVGTLTGKGKAAQALAHIKTTQAFQQLKAVQNNQVVSVDGSLWTSVGGPLAAMAVLDDLASAFEGS